MTLSSAARKQFRTIGHQLKPIVIIAQKGMTENIKAEIDRALNDHELIKIKLVVSSKAEKKALAESICAEFSAECIQSIGQVLLLYKATKNQDLRLSNLLRNRS